MLAPWRCAFVSTTLVLIAILLLAGGSSARAADSVIYTVTGVAVDVTDKDANQAKLRAISEAQVKAFNILADRLGGEGAASRFKKLSAIDIGRMMASLSIEEERSGPGRYIGKLTVRFLPGKIRAIMSKAGISYTEERAPPIVVLPVWKGPDGPVAWQESPWRAAWLSLDPQNALVPLIIPLGDLTDTESVSAEEALAGNELRLEALRMRYSAEAVLVATAEPVEDNGVHAIMVGDSPLGKVEFDKTYTVETGGVDAAAQQAAKRFHAAMIAKWKKSRAPAAPAAATVQSISVAVPFASMEEWSTLRQSILATPGVSGVDVSSLSAGGAVVRLSYAVPFENLKAALAGKRLTLALVGDTWVLRLF